MCLRLQSYCILIATLHIYPIIGPTDPTSTTSPYMANFVGMNGCMFDVRGGLRGWRVLCVEANSTDRVPGGLAQFSNSITSITIKHQPRLLRLHRADMESFKRLKKFVLTQSGLMWIERKTFIRNRDLEFVDLRDNALSTLDWRSVVGLAKVTLDVRQNPFSCNCSNFWLAVWKTDVARKREIVSPGGAIFDLSTSFLMTLPDDIVGVDDITCADASGNRKLSDWVISNAEEADACALPTVHLTPKRISTVEGISKSIQLICEISSKQSLDTHFRDMMQLRIVDANETRSSVRLEKEWRTDGLTLTVSTENVTRGLMGWYMCTAVSDSGPEFDMTSVVVESKPQIRLTAGELTTSEIGQLMERFQFIIIAFPPISSIVWLKNNAPFNVHDETNAAVFTVTREFQTGPRKKAFFYGERLALTVQLIFTYEFYKGDYSLRVCNPYGCDEMMFVSYRNKSWFTQHPAGLLGMGPVIIGGQEPPKPAASVTTETAWIIAAACVSCGLVVCGVAIVFRWIRRPKSPNVANGEIKGLDRSVHSFRLNSYTCNSLYEPLLSTSVPVVPTASLEIDSTLGEGAFGQVYLAYCRLSSNSSGDQGNDDATAVAAKMMKPNLGSECSQDIVREAELMAKLNHANVVTFYGVCLRAREEILLLYEYMDLGDLKRFLALHGPHSELMNAPADTWRLTSVQQIDIALQVAQGLTYLHQSRFVHRDLACRNCLVKSPLIVKLSDFGMSRDIYFSDYYRLTHTAQLPVRWLPPESLCYGRFSDMSDVWSYGVVVWEIASFGEQPWRGHPNVEVMQRIGAGELLTPPEDCQPVLKDIMLSCWKRIPCERIKLDEVINQLTNDAGQS